MENKLVKTSNQLEVIGLTASAYLNESADKLDAFVKNLASFCILNRVQFSEDGTDAIFRIPDYSGGKKAMVEAKVNKEVFILEMYRATLEGLSVLKKECYPVFRKNNERGDYDLQIQVDYKFEMSKFTELGYRIEFIHVRAGDEFVEIKPFLHTMPDALQGILDVLYEFIKTEFLLKIFKNFRDLISQFKPNLSHY